MARRRNYPAPAVMSEGPREQAGMFNHSPGVPMQPATSGGNRSRQWDLEGLIDSPDFVAQTANGTSRDVGTGWNKDYQYSSPELPDDSTRPGGRSNRTGE